MIHLEGIIPPLPTSFHVNEELYPEMIRENIEFLMKYDLTGVLVLGSNGELVMLEDKEKEEVYATAREAVPYGKLMIAGCGGQSTRETVRLTRLAGKHGADAALVLNPFYYKGQMTPDVLVNHYQTVADESPIPVIIYNMPASSGSENRGFRRHPCPYEEVGIAALKAAMDHTGLYGGGRPATHKNLKIVTDSQVDSPAIIP